MNKWAPEFRTLNLTNVVWKRYISFNDDIHVFERPEIQGSQDAVCFALFKKNCGIGTEVGQRVPYCDGIILTILLRNNKGLRFERSRRSLRTSC